MIFFSFLVSLLLASFKRGLFKKYPTLWFKLLTCRSETLISFKVVSLGMLTLLCDFLPLLDELQEDLL